jgi:L-ascorbate metabolism protein UlaG (beta-lactamase superfamily)
MFKTIAMLSLALSCAAPSFAAHGKTELLWLGQSAFRISTPEGKVIVLDPFITQNPKTPPAWKDLSKLGRIDLVLVTHAHGDHFGDAVALVKQHHIQLWAPAGLQDTLVELGLVTTEEAPRMNKGGTITPLGPEIRISQVPAEHSSEFIHFNPETKKRETHVGGSPVGFILRLENGFTIYHAGDTALFGDMKLIAERFHPDLFLVPIGGHFVMDPEAAAEATRLIGPRYAIPMHYGTFPQLKGTPEEYQHALGSAKTQVVVLKPGESKSF